MNIERFFYIIIFIILLVLLGILSLKPPKLVEVRQYDTVLVREPIYIEKEGKIRYKTKVIKLQDTLLVQDSARWESCIDTVVNKVGVNVCYRYPENMFWVRASFVPDTVRLVTVVEKPLLQLQNPSSKNEWWTDVAKIGGGVIIGFFLGKAK